MRLCFSPLHLISIKIRIMLISIQILELLELRIDFLGRRHVPERLLFPCVNLRTKTNPLPVLSTNLLLLILNGLLSFNLILDPHLDLIVVLLSPSLVLVLLLLFLSHLSLQFFCITHFLVVVLFSFFH